VAAKFAKDMELIDLFLSNKKVDLHYCDELGQNVIAYAEKNTYGLRQEIIDRVKEKDDVILKEYNILKLATSESHIPIWKSLAWDLHNYFSSIESDTWLQPLIDLIAHSLLTKKILWKLFYVPFADLRPGKGSEISLTDFIRNEESNQQLNSAESETLNIFGDIAHDSEYTQIQTYQGNSNSKTNFMGASTEFFMFKTTSEKDGERWWSMDFNGCSIVLQRSRDKDAVENKFGGKERKDVTFISSINLEARGSIKNCLALLWALHIIKEKSQENHLKSESFSRITYVEEMEDMGALVKDLVDQNPQFFDLFNILTSTPNSTRLFFPIYYGNAELFDQYVQDFDIDSNEINSALNLAIAFPNKTEMVRHILENYSADPTERLLLGRNALEMAAIHADKTEIIDLLLRQENVDIDGRDEFGRTALHFAACNARLAVTENKSRQVQG
jgi:hypothetical protein